MSTSTIMKKRINVFFISLAVIVVALFLTYFIFGRNSFSTTDVFINNKNIKVTFENGKKGIQFGANPMSFQQGLSSSPSNIYKIVNKSDFSTEFQVIINDKSKENDKIDINKLVVGVNNEDIMLVKDLSNGVIYEGVLDGNSETILNLKFWLDENLMGDEDHGKTLAINVDIKEK